jgi:hypothetical protein
MPTVPQLPAASTVTPSDQLLLSQAGQTYAVTTQTLLAGTQPLLTLPSGALLGRVASGAGQPQAVTLGAGIALSQGTLVADTSIVAPLASPALAGRPTAPTPPSGDNSTAIATTAFVADSNPTITVVGDVVGSGASPVTLVLPPLVSPGVYAKVTVNGKGQVIGGGSLVASDIVAALGFTPASSNSALTIPGTDLSAAVVTATGATNPRTLASLAAERISVLDFGADPTGGADSAPAFSVAMSEVPQGGIARLFVPRGTYRLGEVVDQPTGRSITVELDDGAYLTGTGYLGVDRVVSHQGPYTISQISGGFTSEPTGIGAVGNPAFDFQVIANTPQNSAAARVAWSRNYANYNRYSKYSGGIDFAEQNIYAWPRLSDNTSGWGHWEVISGPAIDEASEGTAGLSASVEHSEFDIVNNGPEAGWTFAAGVGNPVQGMSMDPWGQNGPYGGHLLYAYGTVGSFDGASGGINRRWVSYPAVYSTGNPAAVPQNSTLVITMDVTAKGSASIANGRVTGVSIAAGGGAYGGAPTVVFSGGGGTGAAGSANVVGGAVVGVTITNAGSGYSSAPVVIFTGGGVPAPVATTVNLNGDGAHGDVASIAAAVRAARIPLVGAAVSQWGGAVSSLVIFGTAKGDVGTLTLGGTALAVLGIDAQAYTTQRDDTAVAYGFGHCAPGDQITLNGHILTVGGTGALSDVVAAVTQANVPGLQADITAAGRLVLSAWLVQQPCGLVLDQPSGFTTLQKLGLPSGTVLPPTPPKAFATAYGEVGAGACHTADALTIAATDLAGNSYGPVVVTLNGGAGTGSVADVAASIQASMQAKGWASGSPATLTVAPAIVTAFVRGGGGLGLVVRNTAGGTLTIGNASGTPLDTLGIAAGTYKPGGYSAGSQTVFHAAPNAVAPQGRGVFIGGSTVPDPTVWPHAPAEFRGGFCHGLRTDKASFGDGNALLLGDGQAIGWGIGGAAISASGGTISCTAPVALPGLNLSGLPTSAAGLPRGTVWNNGGVLSIV